MAKLEKCWNCEHTVGKEDRFCQCCGEPLTGDAVLQSEKKNTATVKWVDRKVTPEEKRPFWVNGLSYIIVTFILSVAGLHIAGVATLVLSIFTIGSVLQDSNTPSRYRVQKWGTFIVACFFALWLGFALLASL